MTWTAPTATDLVVVTLGMATVLVAAVTSLPQLVHTVRGRTASGTSPAGLGNLAVGNVAWTLYSWWLGDVWLLVASAVAVPGALLAGSPQVTIVGGTAADIPPEMRAGLEQMLGTDLDGDGRIGGGAPGPAGSAAGSDDRLVQLERLAHLHATGALTAAEFDAEKRRILAS